MQAAAAIVLGLAQLVHRAGNRACSDDGQAGRQADRQMDGWAGGRMDGWTDRRYAQSA
jgi:hypothetical protein